MKRPTDLPLVKYWVAVLLLDRCHRRSWQGEDKLLASTPSVRAQVDREGAILWQLEGEGVLVWYWGDICGFRGIAIWFIYDTVLDMMTLSRGSLTLWTMHGWSFKYDECLSKPSKRSIFQGLQQISDQTSHTYIYISTLDPLPTVC